MNQKLKIQKFMLGHSVQDEQIVIVTPLKSTYKIMQETFKVTQLYDHSFFDNFCFLYNGIRGIIILSPQGLSACDVIELFENKTILFVGLAGSLNKSLSVGEFVEVEQCIDEENNKEKLSGPQLFTLVSCGYSPCMIGSYQKKYFELAQKNKCDVIDMETVYCCKISQKNGNKFTSLLLISDIPEYKNFYELTEGDRRLLLLGRQNFLEQIKLYINYLVR